MNPELQVHNGRPALRIERRLAHRPEKVWRALTESAHVNQWFPFDVEMELRLGGKVNFIEKNGEGPPSDGVITEFDPPRFLAYSWVDDLLQFELRPEGEGCLLIFTHTFDDRAGAASFAAGWQVCLDAMEIVLAGKPINAADYVGPGWSHKMADLHEIYAEAFGLSEGSTRVTPDGWEVRFERQLTQPADKVWTMLTASAAPGVGHTPPQAFTTAQVPAGTITAVEAPTFLEYDWQGKGRPVGRVRWELTQGTGHGARLILTQTGPSDLAHEQSTTLAAWKTHIERLAAQLLGRPISATAGGLGTLHTTADGRFALRFERILAHSPQKVWRAITEPEQLQAWFPAVVDFDLRPGARLRFAPTPEQKRRYGMTEDQATYGEITQVEPPNLLEYTWGEETLRWELRTMDDGGCQLVFTNLFDDREMAAAAGAGWHAGLEVVEAQLDGRVVDWSPWDRAEQLTEEYVRVIHVSG